MGLWWLRFLLFDLLFIIGHVVGLICNVYVTLGQRQIRFMLMAVVGIGGGVAINKVLVRLSLYRISVVTKPEKLSNARRCYPRLRWRLIDHRRRIRPPTFFNSAQPFILTLLLTPYEAYVSIRWFPHPRLHFHIDRCCVFADEILKLRAFQCRVGETITVIEMAAWLVIRMLNASMLREQQLGIHAWGCVTSRIYLMVIICEETKRLR